MWQALLLHCTLVSVTTVVLVLRGVSVSVGVSVGVGVGVGVAQFGTTKIYRLIYFLGPS